ncbi:glutaredoxin family protein [Corynebacterium silvaticum]|uniref:Glutaredoxin family protein n=1 Tax=Corynebacterium silvaticum TaxID=2320431 RepID=A0A7Y4LIC6_9CORY|nr:glutaredoxin family protein [Corynebacterium silvaticum]ARU45446.1 glutaredoxin family protein [Corynebacterium silvaticum]MBH5300018.1 glutaredoxin family protein [Corynebacterium silvaticum]NOM65457.1 glutaredoxin family protein [Corynebacterium silvaticum]NON70614.1 glutaredoxin family protein [Corynebacterium silvaticum]TFA92343.1 glutaredoxin family protein [Corynebacterium silvaticum]
MSGVENAREVELMTRKTCGSCRRVAEQIIPVVAAAGAVLSIIDVDTDRALAAEYGDRVPVVVIDGEEFACWEVDNDELAAELGS